MSRLVWIDLEMTGLDSRKHVIIEIASIVTDDDLEIVAEVNWSELGLVSPRHTSGTTREGGSCYSILR